MPLRENALVRALQLTTHFLLPFCFFSPSLRPVFFIFIFPHTRDFFLDKASLKVSNPIDESKRIRVAPENFISRLSPLSEILKDFSPLDMHFMLEEYGIDWKCVGENFIYREFFSSK
jgi:hypothetical protein